MKKVAFVVSHFGSGSFDLIKILNKNPKCNFFNSNAQYSHPDDLRWMYNQSKLKNYSGSILAIIYLKMFLFLVNLCIIIVNLYTLYARQDFALVKFIIIIKLKIIYCITNLDYAEYTKWPKAHLIFYF